MKYPEKIPDLIVKAPANLFGLMVRWSDNLLVQILLWRVKHFLGEMLCTYIRVIEDDRLSHQLMLHFKYE